MLGTFDTNNLHTSHIFQEIYVQRSLRTHSADCAAQYAGPVQYYTVLDTNQH